jgi:hypothetical protein
MPLSGQAKMGQDIKDLRSRLGRGLNGFSFAASSVSAEGALAQVRGPAEQP